MLVVISDLHQRDDPKLAVTPEASAGGGRVGR